MITKTALGLLAGLGAVLHPQYTLGPGQQVQTATSVQRAIAIESASPRPAWILADVERWDYTTRYQQEHPAWAIERICAIAHAHGSKCMAAPALDLFSASPSRYFTTIARAARYADAWEIQSQTLELKVASYSGFTDAAARDARAAHKGIVVLAGLTTSDRIGEVTGWNLLHAVRSVRDHVTRFWLNIPGGGPECPSCGTVEPKPAYKLLALLHLSG